MEIAEAVGDILLQVGSVVGVFIPQVGVALTIIKNVGAIVGIFTGGGKVLKLPALDAAAVENAALRAIATYDSGKNVDFLKSMVRSCGYKKLEFAALPVVS